MTRNTGRAKLPPCEGKYVFRSLVTVDVVLAGSVAANPTSSQSRHDTVVSPRATTIRISNVGAAPLLIRSVGTHPFEQLGLHQLTRNIAVLQWQTSGSEPRPETCVLVVKGLRLSYEDPLRSVRGSGSV